MITIAIILFIIGCILLLFNKNSGQIDLLGFMFIIAGFLIAVYHTIPNSVDLPEEYKEIKPNTPIQGKYDEKTDIVYIWFDHTKK